MALYTDGKAVEVTIPSGVTVVKDQAVNIDGWHGIAMEDGAAGDVIAIEVASRVHTIEVGSTITAAKGDVLYITKDDTNVVNNTTTDRPFGKVVVAKDSNNIVAVRVLENK